MIDIKHININYIECQMVKSAVENKRGGKEYREHVVGKMWEGDTVLHTVSFFYG